MPFLDREDAGLRAPTRVTPLPTHPATHLFVHHGASGVSDSLRDRDGDGAPDGEESVWRAYQAYHMDTKGWSDIAYSFGFGKSGWRYEGRGWGRQGGATGSPEDRYSYSYCAIGNFQTMEVPDEMIQAMIRQTKNGIRKGFFVPADELIIMGHKDRPASTSCPGSNLYARLDEIREGILEEEPEPVLPPITLEMRVANLERAVFGAGRTD